MSAYMVVSAKIYNSYKFSEYGKAMEKLIKSYNGEYLAKGNIADILEGHFDESRKVLIAKYPSVERIHKMWNSKEYKLVKKLRENIADVDVIVINGLGST